MQCADCDDCVRVFEAKRTEEGQPARPIAVGRLLSTSWMRSLASRGNEVAADAARLWAWDVSYMAAKQSYIPGSNMLASRTLYERPLNEREE